ncbi:MAG: hypothetical protein ACI39Q_00650 [Wujia sp.]
MRLFILKETPLSLAMSILGAICLIMSFLFFQGELWIALIVSAVLTIFFYTIAFISQNKARKRRLQTEKEYAEKKFKLSS